MNIQSTEYTNDAASSNLYELKADDIVNNLNACEIKTEDVEITEEEKITQDYSIKVKDESSAGESNVQPTEGQSQEENTALQHSNQSGVAPLRNSILSKILSEKKLHLLESPEVQEFLRNKQKVLSSCSETHD
ncbi:Uncharacterised protein r2_g3872 [Pycnogonum litorale]